MAKRGLVVPLLLGLAAGSLQTRSPCAPDGQDRLCQSHWGQFQEFRAKYDKVYPDQSEVARRFGCFRANLALAARQNAAAASDGPLRATHGVNGLADLCKGEATRRLDLPPTSSPEPMKRRGKEGCRKINWLKKGAQLPAFTEGYNCYTGGYIAAAYNIASRWFLAGRGPLTQLSPKAILDCSKKINGNAGCDGNTAANGFDYALRNGGLPTLKRYPYRDELGKCQKDLEKPVFASIHNHTYLPKNESIMADIVYSEGPIVAAAYAAEWHTYAGGIYKGCGTFTEPDLSVTVFGFDECHDPPYWLVQPPFGPDFGIDGYLLLKMGVDECGVAKYPSTSYVHPAAPVPPRAAPHAAPISPPPA